MLYQGCLCIYIIIYNFCIEIQKQTEGSVIKTRHKLRFKADFQRGVS